MSETPSNTSQKSSSVGPSGRTIIYDEDGKPCRSCNTLLDFKFATNVLHGKTADPVGAASKAAAAAVVSATIPGSKHYLQVDPPDVEELGRSSWTLLHTAAAKYPRQPSDVQKQEMRQFLSIFSHIYPCNWCAKDFEQYLRDKAPRVESRDELGQWMCEAHNEVNQKLGKEPFDCNFWKKRWLDGWE
ncbi:AaceriABR037Wp [[Ashbya] aceris (nom. inval.)]|nr:AaceriABR037Wp [[Ashbya] aceris (nom. inval.)]